MTDAAPQAPNTLPDPSVSYELRGAALDAALCQASGFPPHSGRSIAWLHVPKCGSTFLATVLAYACPRLPAELGVAQLIHDEARAEKQREAARQQQGGAPPRTTLGGLPGAAVLQTNVWALLDGQHNLTRSCIEHGYLVDHGRAVLDGSGAVLGWKPHMPQRNWAIEAGHMVALFRPPAQRLLSAFYQDAGPHGVPRAARAALRTPAAYARFCAPTGRNGREAPPAGASNGQCQANRMCAYVLGRPCRAWADVREAVSHLRRSFAFVGLTDQWAASVCLFHRRLGGAPVAGEFEASRVNSGGERRAGKYDESLLGDYRDEYDEVLYQFARARFLHELHNATGWRCAIDEGAGLLCSAS